MRIAIVGRNKFPSVGRKVRIKINPRVRRIEPMTA
jgi:hypothetical protein